MSLLIFATTRIYSLYTRLQERIQLYWVQASKWMKERLENHTQCDNIVGDGPWWPSMYAVGVVSQFWISGVVANFVVATVQRFCYIFHLLFTSSAFRVYLGLWQNSLPNNTNAAIAQLVSSMSENWKVTPEYDWSKREVLLLWRRIWHWATE
jgi:hypothetical protein